MRWILLVSLSLLTLATAANAQETASKIGSQQPGLDIANRITPNALHGNLQFLADDLLEGRGPGSKGDSIAQLYLESQFKRMGLVPVPSMKSYRQKFPMLGLTSTAAKTWTIGSADKAGSPLEFQYFKDYIAVAGSPKDKIALKDAEIVQMREKLPEKAVPAEPSVAKQAPQNYYFESLMLQNDQIQIELRRINEIVNS